VDYVTFAMTALLNKSGGSDVNGMSHFWILLLSVYNFVDFSVFDASIDRYKVYKVETRTYSGPQQRPITEKNLHVSGTVYK